LLQPVKEYQLVTLPSQTCQQTSDTLSPSYSPPLLHTRKSKTRLRHTLQTAVTTTKIETETTTETTRIVTETTKTVATIEHPEDVAMSARKRIAAHRSTQRRNATRPRKSTETASIIELRDGSTIVLKNTSNSTSSTMKETIVKT
jgi:hypothetical protein